MSDAELVGAAEAWLTTWDEWLAADRPEEEGPAPFIACELLRLFIRRLGVGSSLPREAVGLDESATALHAALTTEDAKRAE